DVVGEVIDRRLDVGRVAGRRAAVGVRFGLREGGAELLDALREVGGDALLERLRLGAEAALGLLARGLQLRRLTLARRVERQLLGKLIDETVDLELDGQDVTGRGASALGRGFREGVCELVGALLDLKRVDGLVLRGRLRVEASEARSLLAGRL